MRPALLICIGAAATLAGCSTAPNPYAEAPGRTSGYLSISGSNAVLAEALANYAVGVLREGQHDPGAVSNYLRAATLAPETDALYLRAAVQYLRSGDIDRGIAIMEEACRANPRSADTSLLLSQICQVANRPEESMKAALRAVELSPEDSKGYIQMASLLVASGDEEGARQALRGALKKIKDPLPVLRLLGDLYSRNMSFSGSSSPELKQAIAYYEEAADYPTDEASMTYLQRLGDLYLINRQPAQALSCFQKICVHDPDNLQARQKQALCFLALGEKDKAIEALKAISGRENQPPDLYYYLGDLYETLGDEQHAIENFKSARDADPFNPKSYLKMATIHMRDDPQKAREILQEGLKRLPRERLFLEILLQLYLRNNQHQEALAMFDQISAAVPSGDPALKNERFFIQYGLAAQRCEQFAKAAAMFARAIELDPDSLEARVRLAMVHVWMRDNEEALAVMEETIYARPADPAAWYFYAIVGSRAGMYAAAVEAFRIAESLALREGPGLATALDSDFYFNYGAACERLGQYGEAQRLLHRAMALDPGNSDAFNYMAYTWAERNEQLNLAMEYIVHALDIEPENGAYLDTLGWILYRQERYAEALEYIKEAAWFMPGDPTITEHRGDILAAMGRMEEAIRFWKQSFAADSSNTALGEKLRKHGVDPNSLPLDTLQPSVLSPFPGD